MKSKNERIAGLLKQMGVYHQSLSTSMNILADILLERDSVPAATVATNITNQTIPAYVPAKKQWVGITKKSLEDVLGSVGKSLHKNIVQDTDAWKEQMTAEINANNAKAVAEAVGRSQRLAVSDEAVIDKPWDSPLVREIFRNSTTIFYKRVKGVLKGTILSVNRETKQITDHKYLVTKSLKGQLCLVSKDQDGIDYVNNVVRPSLIKRKSKTTKIVRFYRPNATDQQRHGIMSSRYVAIYLDGWECGRNY